MISKQNILSVLIILLLTFISFFPAIHNGFVNWDDPGYVIDNPLIRKFSFDNFKQIFSSFINANYHPLTILSYAVEYYFVQLQPKLYHVTNIILHLLNTVLVFWLVFLLTRKNVTAFVTSLLFGIHPMHVESVAWISERKDVLYAFFYLGALISYIFYLEKENKKNKFYLLTLLLFLLSLFSKPMAVTLPFCLLLIDFYFKRKFSWQLIWEKKYFFLLSIIFGFVAYWSQQDSHAIHESNQFFTWMDNIFPPFYSMFLYLEKLIVPTHLTCLYPFPAKTDWMLPRIFYGSTIIISLLGFIVFITQKYTRDILFGSLFFLTNLILVIHIIPFGSAIIADRYSYLSYLGIFFIIGNGFDFLFSLQSKWKYLATVHLTVFVLWLGWLAHQRCKVWKDDVSLWSDALSKYPTEIGFANLGLFYKNNGQTDVAMQYYNNAIAVNPGYLLAYQNRGNIFFSRNQLEPAMADYETALRINSNSEAALNSKGAVFFADGKYDSALVYFNRAIAIKDNYPDAYMNRANTYSTLGKFELALNDYNQYLAVKSTAEMYFWRGEAKRNLKMMNEAIADFTSAINLKPNLAESYLKRSISYSALGKYDLALQDALKAQVLGYKVDESYLEGLKK